MLGCVSFSARAEPAKAQPASIWFGAHSLLQKIPTLARSHNRPIASPIAYLPCRDSARHNQQIGYCREDSRGNDSAPAGVNVAWSRIRASRAAGYWPVSTPFAQFKNVSGLCVFRNED